MDTFPYDSWEQATNASQGAGDGFYVGELFSTFGPGDNFGTILLVVVGFVVMIGVFVAWIRTEDTKLRAQAERLRSAAGSTEGV